jgi:hypothetical protein
MEKVVDRFFESALHLRALQKGARAEVGLRTGHRAADVEGNRARAAGQLGEDRRHRTGNEAHRIAVQGQHHVGVEPALRVDRAVARHLKNGGLNNQMAEAGRAVGDLEMGRHAFEHWIGQVAHAQGSGEVAQDRDALEFAVGDLRVARTGQLAGLGVVPLALQGQRSAQRGG